MIIVNNIYVQHNEFKTIGEKKEEKKQGVFVMEVWKKAMELDEAVLKNLWNKFINESGMHGEDSYIYDFKNKEDISDLVNGISNEEYQYLLKIIGDRRYFQVIWNLNGDQINVVSPKEQVNAYWSDIITRVINFPSFYQQINGESKDDTCYFYEDVICPILCEKLGVEKIKNC